MIQLNSREIPFEQFPNGETKFSTAVVDEWLSKQTADSVNLVTFNYKEDGDLINLLFLKKYMDSQLTHAQAHNVALVISYMPYSRMDRPMGGAAFTLKYVTDFINSLNFATVGVIEPHSDVTPALLERSKTISLTQELLDRATKEVDFDVLTDYLIYPDAGAQKRYAGFSSAPSLVGYKQRDLTTGRITEFQMVGELKGNARKAIIVDDLSSYGGTFILAARQLRALGFKQVHLLVTHAENSIFDGDLFKTALIDKVFTTNSILDKKFGPVSAKNRLHIYPVDQLL